MRNPLARFANPDVAELYRWSVALAGLAYWANMIAGSHSANPLALSALSASIFGAGAFNAAAWIMITGRCARKAPPCLAPTILVWGALVSGLLFVMPIGLALTPALFLLGITLLLHPALPRSRREAGLLLLGLAASWGWPFLRFVHIVAGQWDAWAIAGLARLAGWDVSVQGNIVAHGNFSIEILPACASSGPLAGVVLAYAMVKMYFLRGLAKADLLWLAASLLYSIVLTEIRLSLMVPSWADWNWWHNGAGVTIYELAALAGAIFFPWAASRRPPWREAPSA